MYVRILPLAKLAVFTGYGVITPAKCNYPSLWYVIFHPKRVYNGFLDKIKEKVGYFG